jgi:type I restriction-modification system DNA methylase subunit
VYVQKLHGGIELKKVKILHKSGQEHRDTLIKLFDRFQHRFNIWQVWDDFIYMSATAFSQPCQWVQERENEYLRRINRYPAELQQLFPDMLAEIVMAFEQEGFSDILGELYMMLNLGNHWRGQYFTPYEICLMMAKMSAENPAEEIEKQGYISVSDPACGSGAMLIAFVQNSMECGVNYQRDVLFVGQDVDPVVARMCFISLSLLGCPGYVIVGDVFTQPAVGHVLSPVSNNGSDIWFTPMFFSNTWQYRRLIQQVILIVSIILLS